MADRPDPQAKAGHNAPGLSLHVPEPKFRPGDAVDFSHVDVGEPGKQPRPDEARLRDAKWRESRWPRFRTNCPTSAPRTMSDAGRD